MRGDVEAGLKESDRVIERFYRCPTMWSGGMEPRACVAQWDGDHLTLWAATQAPYRVHGSLAAMFNVPDANVRVIASYVGGGFGTKSAPHTDEALAAMLARKAHRPVKLRYTREEEILDSNTRFETKVYIPIVNGSVQLSWAWYVLLFLLIAGTVPFASFIAERQMVKKYGEPS